MPGIDRSPRGPDLELDISHLFTGHEMHPGSKLVLAGKNQSPERSVTFEIEERTAKECREASLADMESRVEWQAKDISRVIRTADPERHGIELSLLRHVSPIEWDNIVL